MTSEVTFPTLSPFIANWIVEIDVNDPFRPHKMHGAAPYEGADDAVRIYKNRC